MRNFDDSLLGGDEPFAIGAAGYLDAVQPLREKVARIYVQFRPQGVDPERAFPALLDTGAHYCILNRDVASLIEDQLTDHLGNTALRTAHGPVHGDLYVHEIVLIAETGKDLVVPMTVFVPPEWHAPSFLGYTGALDGMRLAFDAPANRVYFGAD